MAERIVKSKANVVLVKAEQVDGYKPFVGLTMEERLYIHHHLVHALAAIPVEYQAVIDSCTGFLAGQVYGREIPAVPEKCKASKELVGILNSYVESCRTDGGVSSKETLSGILTHIDPKKLPDLQVVCNLIVDHARVCKEVSYVYDWYHKVVRTSLFNTMTNNPSKQVVDELCMTLIGNDSGPSIVRETIAAHKGPFPLGYWPIRFMFWGMFTLGIEK